MEMYFSAPHTFLVLASQRPCPPDLPVLLQAASSLPHLQLLPSTPYLKTCGYMGPGGPRAPHIHQTQGVPAAQPAPPWVLHRFHNGQKLGVSLDGHCSHTQALMKLVSSPPGNPGPLPSVCCTQLPPKRAWCGKEKSNCTVEAPNRYHLSQ